MNPLSLLKINMNMGVFISAFGFFFPLQISLIFRSPQAASRESSSPSLPPWREPPLLICRVSSSWLYTLVCTYVYAYVSVYVVLCGTFR